MRVKRIDGNQRAIVDTLRKIPGVTVATNHDDILVGYRGFTYWYELKDRTGRNRLQPSQQKLIDQWKGHYEVVHDVDQILIELGIINKT